MAKLVLGLEPQIDFPHSDISESNARMVAVMLANPVILQEHHKTAEEAFKIYVIGHTAINYALDTVFTPSKKRAASVGVAIYEAVSSLVQPIPDNPNLLKKLEVLPTDPEETLSNLFEMYSTFLSDMPKTTEVIEEIAQPIIEQQHVSYVVLGAAAARSFELTEAA